MPAASILRREAGPLLRFCFVGSAGFIADAGILAVLIHGLGAGPLLARSISAPLAVLLTFLLNRNWAFAHAPRMPIHKAFPAYVAVQGTGLACNLLIYAAAVMLFPHPFGDPLIAVSIASICALAVNYLGARFLVFRGPSAAGSDALR